MRKTALATLLVVSSYVSNAQNTFPATGRAGIGITVPQAPLHILNNTNLSSILLESNSDGWGSGLVFKNTAATGRTYGIYSSAWGSFHLVDNLASVNRLYINNAGNIGIGTDGPWARLDVRTDGAAGTGQYALNLQNPATTAYAAVSMYLSTGSTSFSVLTAQRNNLTGGSRMFFQNTDNSGALQSRAVLNEVGNMGIGIDAPLDKLHVKNRIRIEDNADNGNIGGSLLLSHTGKTTTGQAKDWVIYNMGGVYGNSLQFWSYEQSGCPGGCDSRFTIMDNGNVGIGTMAPQAKLAVNGDVFAKKVKVTLNGWPDYVFDKGYKLAPLSVVEKYIQQHKHLPDMPSAAEVEKNGVDLGDNQAVLLKKIEELTLYMIEQGKQLELQNKKLAAQQALLMEQQQKITRLEKTTRK